jgi:hypothetical protein
MRHLIISGLAAAALMAMAPSGAQARFFDPSLPAAASHVEQAQCRTVRVRTRLPNGRVVIRTTRRCGYRPYYRPYYPVYRPYYVGPRRCWTQRTVVRRPGGRTVVRVVRRCR